MVRRAWLLGGVAGAVVLSALVAMPGAAGASSATGQPTGIWKPFAGCPVQKIKTLDPKGINNANDTQCFFVDTYAGSFTIGSGTPVSITKPAYIQFGEYVHNDKIIDVAPTNGPILYGGAEPAGDVFPAPLNDDAITATTVLAGSKVPGVNLGAVLSQKGIASTLDIKIHLTDAEGLLGSSCYIGSNSDPVVLHLTDGKTKPPSGVKPLKGSIGNVTDVADNKVGGTVIYDKKLTLVDNTFAVPAASGCGTDGLLDTLVNNQEGLPAAAGASSAVLVQDGYIAVPAGAVLKNEETGK